jgi:hypothetical protein
MVLEIFCRHRTALGRRTASPIRSKLIFSSDNRSARFSRTDSRIGFLVGTTGIIEVLARQLGGRIEVTTGAQGTTVSVLSTTTQATRSETASLAGVSSA